MTLFATNHPQGSYKPNGGSAQIPGAKSQLNLAPPADVQLIVLADCSGSMSGSKTSEANSALKALFTASADPITRDAIRISVITFSDYGTVTHSEATPENMTLVGDIVYGGGGTMLADSLRMAQQEISKHTVRQGRKTMKPFVVILSDGCVGDPTEAITVAQQIKQEAYVLTVGFGSDADEGFLTALASAPNHYSKAQIGQLQKLMTAIGQSVSRYSAII